ncbi:efflux RND transporter periplasmic adaptor subunit [Geomonas subterranea]|uniref:efflux RND transporter periplasmic adaptor subunit n=1 Tax=Geomonas subterranea TaxID=2847989 RepID=UPI001CD71034|nr:efflux RND transporter periplasmic adaptor subunit [Geomonas fuzhouensis]
MNRKGIIIGLVLTIALGGGVAYRLINTPGSGGHAEHGEHAEAGHAEEKGGHAEEKGGHTGGREEEGHDEHGEKLVKMAVEVQKQNGVAVAPVKKSQMPGVISATGKVEANADRIAHVSPRISGKIVAVRASLGDSVGGGQVLATLDSVELGEAMSRYHQSKTRLALAQSNMERVKVLVDKKIAARKEILQAETDYKTAQTELHTDQERLSLYGVSAGDLKGDRKPLLPVRAPIGGVITEKHAIVGELSDPAKSLYTIADLSSVWVLVDIHEKDLAKVRRGQTATVAVSAFPETKFRGRVTYLADVVDQATRTIKARVEVANPGRKLKPEMFATVELATAADASQVLAIPEEAVVELEGKKLIFVAEGDAAFEPRKVELGRASGGMVEVLSGLKEGERLAVKGGFVLKSELQKGEISGHDH